MTLRRVDELGIRPPTDFALEGPGTRFTLVDSIRMIHVNRDVVEQARALLQRLPCVHPTILAQSLRDQQEGKLVPLLLTPDRRRLRDEVQRPRLYTAHRSLDRR